MFHDASLAILCGGAGKRLGGMPKGLLRLHGRTFIERLLSLRAHFADTFLVTSDAAPYERFGVRSVPDGFVGTGTPGAVTSALCAAKTEWTFITAVDMPLLSEAAISELATARTVTAGVVAPLIDGAAAPLGAFYRSVLRERFAERLEEGETPSVRELWAPAEVRTVAPSVVRAFFNVNTDDELKEIGASRPSAW